MSELLSVRDLEVSADIAGERVPVIRRLSFALRASRVLGLVGESGAGKSMVGRAIAQLLPPGFAIAGGSCLFAGEDMVRMSSQARRALLGRSLAFIPQSPQTALDPLRTVGQQFDEHLRHADATLPKRTRRERAIAMLAAVHLPGPEQLLSQYPHQLSGGMCQRVLIAMAFASNPRLLIADEPTTALDVTIQLRILQLIAEMQEHHRTALIFITHDLRLATHICDEIMVMYAGAAVEIGPGRAVFSAPAHPYTRCLKLAEPSMTNSEHVPLVLREQMPGLVELQRMSGCHFAPRCPNVIDECRRTRPALIELAAGRSAACLRSAATGEIVAPPGAGRSKVAAGESLLRVEGLSKRYPAGGGMFSAHAGVIAVDNVEFSIAANEFVALVGESGSGKSTVAKLLVGIERPSAGRILINGIDTTGSSRATRLLRIATVQMIFQDPQSALNPRRRVASIVTQAMEAGSRHATWRERLERTRELLREVGMSPELAARYPPQLSGGQRQRVNIARALCTRAKLIVADEIVSGLDVSVQAQLLHLLLRLRDELGFAMLFISHDLSVVRYLCSRVLTMYRGAIVEQGRTEEVFAAPQHPYTRALLAAVPPEDPAAQWTSLDGAPQPLERE
jgi:peptide/nickel transport system ATP-binding protein